MYINTANIHLGQVLNTKFCTKMNKILFVYISNSNERYADTMMMVLFTKLWYVLDAPDYLTLLRLRRFSHYQSFVFMSFMIHPS